MSAKDKLVAYAAEQAENGSIYVLGAQGQTGSEITEAWIKYREHDKAANYKRAIAFWKKQLGKGFSNLRAYDCSGLVVAFLLAEGLIKSDLTANGLYYSACDAIEKSELAAGDLVFKKYATNTRIYHVGVYMGDGTVVHAKGRDYGVVRESISKTNWNRYGRLKVFGAITEEDEDMYLIYAFQKAARAAEYETLKNGATWKDIVTGENNGCDNSKGPWTKDLMHVIQAKHGLPKSDDIDAALMNAVMSEVRGNAEIEKIKVEYASFQKKVDAYKAGVQAAAAMKI